MTTAIAEKATVAPWGIEIVHPRNADVLVQGIPNCRLRSSVNQVKDVFTLNPETKEQEITTAPAHLIVGLPSNIPGQQLHIDPANGTWKISDPITKDEPKLERIRKAVQIHTNMSVSDKLRGVAMRKGNLGKDQMKTLLRELFSLVELGHAKVVNGMKPDLDDIDDMPGDYLTNPLNRTKWHQPKHEKDIDAWADTLNRVDKPSRQ